MQGSISKKRLYEERLVRLIAKYSILKAFELLDDARSINVDNFLDDNFDQIVKDALETE